MILQSLMIPLPVIMSGVLAGRLPRRSFSEEDHPIEAHALERPHKALRVGVLIRLARLDEVQLDAVLVRLISDNYFCRDVEK